MDSNWNEIRNQGLDDMTRAERGEFQRGLADAKIALNIAQMVYDARQAAGLSQSELARRARTTQSAISAIESTTKVPTVHTLDRVARALGSTLEITFSEPAKPQISRDGINHSERYTVWLPQPTTAPCSGRVGHRSTVCK